MYKKRQVSWTRKDSVITPLLAGSVNSPNNHRDSLIEGMIRTAPTLHNSLSHIHVCVLFTEIADSIGDGSTKPKRLKLEGLSWVRTVNLRPLLQTADCSVAFGMKQCVCTVLTVCLCQPRGRHVGVKVQWFCELPFSLLRWLSIPSCNQV